MDGRTHPVKLDSDSNTIDITRESRFSGQLKFSGTLIVEGEVEGELEATRIIILDVPMKDRLVGVGFVADCVFEVTDIDEQAIEPVPEVGGKWQSDYAAGIGRKGEKFVVIFDLAKLMANDELPGSAPRAA